MVKGANNMNSSEALGLLPQTLRDELLEVFNLIVSNFHQGKWEPSELNGGKFCEVVYSIIKGYSDGVFPLKSTKPSNMLVACQQLEKLNKTLPRSLRIQIPRMLIALYEVRNTRGVGHVGGEVNSNLMDSTMVLYTSKWILAELVRVFHNVDTKTATSVVESLMERDIPIIWDVKGKKRVLNIGLSMKNKVLVLLSSEMGSIKETDLVSWVEHTNPSVFRRDVIIPGHKERLWEYDKETKEITLSPLGMREAEKLV
jgi:hypothetical protein